MFKKPVTVLASAKCVFLKVWRSDGKTPPLKIPLSAIASSFAGIKSRNGSRGHSPARVEILLGLEGGKGIIIEGANPRDFFEEDSH